jgi:uncharacterized membrane protein
VRRRTVTGSGRQLGAGVAGAARLPSADMAEDEEAPAGARDAGDPTTYDLGRLLAFSDGVFAIAITLLVLSIPVPDLPTNLPPAALGPELLQALTRLLPNLVGFGLSFALVGTNWTIHHRMLRGVTTCPPWLLPLNLLLLFWVCLVPFTSALLIRYGGVAVATAVYALNQGLISLTAWSIQLRLALHRRGDWSETLSSLAIALVFLGSIAIAFWRTEGAWILWIVAGSWGRAAILRLWRRLAAPWAGRPAG